MTMLGGLWHAQQHGLPMRSMTIAEADALAQYGIHVAMMRFAMDVRAIDSRLKSRITKALRKVGDPYPAHLPWTNPVELLP